ncbi:MAG: methyltransferase domain-containing protein [Bacillota bacterium]|jgi:2-polyprenyl-6-hydroxyphenyl methylase/3-demethylubiquinone-9 3-methyltransferase
MANHDQVNLRYYGLINTEESHKATQFRVHWMCKQAAGKKVLDIGCSQGITSILLGREGFDVTGVDLEETSINYANEELKKESKLVQDKVKFLLHDATTLDKSLGKFDTVILGEVLEHFSHPHKILKRVHLSLNDKGRVLVTVPFGLHPFHDHKQTFYIGNLAYLLDLYFEEIKIEVHYKYICYVGRKRERIKSNFEIEYTPEQLKKWIKLDEENFLQIEKKNEKLFKDRKQRLEVKENQIKEMQKRIEQMNKQLDLFTLQQKKIKEMSISKEADNCDSEKD